jgi:cytochrome c-type biogenesis protein CcmE
MTRKKRRFMIIACCGVVLSTAVGLVLVALKQNITFFRSPADVVALSIKAGTRFRLGGLVEAGSVVKGANNIAQFNVTDGTKSLKVNFDGILPDLFREGQGIVSEGILQNDGSFKADTVLAKHDENYMPREVADALKKQGVWQGDKKL